MSDRLTPEWTPTLNEAFGETGLKGREGELYVKQVIESWGWEVTDNESSHADQVAGRDLWIKKPEWSNFYSVDVKANMGENGSFYVDPKQWMDPKKKNDRFWHVNVKTGRMAWYARQDMQYYIQTKNLTEGFWVFPSSKLPVQITWRKSELQLSQLV